MQNMEESGRADEFVPFQLAGSSAKGQFRCASCAYGITIHDELPTCPMCAGTSWEPVAWTPFGHARELNDLRASL